MKLVWAGRMLSALGGAILLMDGVMKVAQARPAIESTVALGYRGEVVLWLGILLIACAVLYLIPQTAPAGAILLTAIWETRLRHKRGSATRCSPTRCFRSMSRC